MEKLLMLGTSTGSVEIVEHAKNRGMYTIVTDDLPPERSAAKLIADECWQISTNDLDALETACREAGVTAIMTGVSEFNIDMQIELCARLCLPCYTTAEAFHFNRNKADFKEMCRKCGVPVAKDYYLTDALTAEELAAVEYPVVVKPVDQCANRGVSFCANEDELRKGYQLARSFSSNERIIVEQRLMGEEYVIHYAIADKNISLITYRRWFKNPGKPECYTLNYPSVDKIEEFEQLDFSIRQMLNEMDCREGVVFIQMLQDKPCGNFCVTEMGYRLAGGEDWLRFDGFNAIEWMLNCARNGGNNPETLPPSQIEFPTRPGCTYIIWSKKDGRLARVEGIEEIRRMGIFVHECHKVGEAIHAWQYGYILNFFSSGWEEMLETVRKINSLIVAQDEHGEDLLLRFTNFKEVEDSYKRSKTQIKQ